MADTDQEMFESALSDTPVEAVETPSEPVVQPRDESGRFAAKEKPQEPVADPVEPEKPQDKDHGIPPWRLREEADARRAAEERAARLEREFEELRRSQIQQQPRPEPKPAPNVFEDPDGYTRYVQDQQSSHLQQSRLEARFELSETLMRDKMGDERFDELRKWALGKTQDPAFEAKMMGSKHPWGEASRLFDQERVLSQVGADPNAWFEKQLEERLKDQAFSGKMLERIRGNVQQNGRPPVTQLPPSLNKATAAAPPGGDGEDEGEAGLLKSALRR